MKSQIKLFGKKYFFTKIYLNKQTNLFIDIINVLLILRITAERNKKILKKEQKYFKKLRNFVSFLDQKIFSNLLKFFKVSN